MATYKTPVRIGDDIPLQQFKAALGDTVDPAFGGTGLTATELAAGTPGDVVKLNATNDGFELGAGGGGSSDALGTGFTSGGGTGSIPGTTNAVLDDDGHFKVAYYGNINALDVSSATGTEGIFFQSKSSLNYFYANDDSLGFGTEGGTITMDDTNITADPYSGLGIVYANDYSATIAANDRSIPDVGTVKLIARPYLVYTALLTQSGTDAPTAVVLENTLGGTPTWSYDVNGSYYATLTGAFAVNKTVVICGTSANISPSTNIGFASSRDSVDFIHFVTQGYNDTGYDDILNETPIEIRVYP